MNKERKVGGYLPCLEKIVCSCHEVCINERIHRLSQRQVVLRLSNLMQQYVLYPTIDRPLNIWKQCMKSENFTWICSMSLPALVYM